MDNECDNVIRNCTQAIRMNPNDSNAYYYRGLAYGKKGNYDEAIADFTKAITIDPPLASKINPAFALAYVSRGLPYTEMGDYDKAIDE